MPSPVPTRRFPTPAWLIYSLLVVEGLLWLSEQWFPNGWAVLIAVAAVAATMLVMLAWFVASLIFRWRFQFAVRSLLVLTVAVAVACSWMTAGVKHAREQRQAIEWINTLHRSVEYDWQIDGRGSGPPGPAALRKALGDDFFASATRVCLSAADTDEAGLEPLKGLACVEALWLDAAKISDAALANLEGLTRLRVLSLGYNPLTDDGMKRLQGLRQLQDIDLRGTGITDAGLERLKQKQWRVDILTSGGCALGCTFFTATNSAASGLPAEYGRQFLKLPVAWKASVTIGYYFRTSPCGCGVWMHQFVAKLEYTHSRGRFGRGWANLKKPA